MPSRGRRIREFGVAEGNRQAGIGQMAALDIDRYQSFVKATTSTSR